MRLFWTNEFFRGGVVLTSSSFIINICNYLFNILVGRALGPVGYGEITTLFSYITIISIPVIILSTIIVQKIASAENDRYTLAHSIENYFWQKAVRWWYIIVALFIVTPIVPSITNLSIVSAYSLLPLILLSFIASFYAAELQGLSKFLLFSLVGISAVLFKLIGAVVVSIGIDGVFTIILFLFLSYITIWILSKFFLYRNYSAVKKSKSPPRIEKRLVTLFLSPQFVITTFSIFGLSLFGNIDIVYIKKFFTAQEAGIYSSWSLFAKMILYIVGPITAVGLVYFAKGGKTASQIKSLILSLILLSFVGLTSYFAYFYFGTPILHLFFGNKFAEVIPFLSYAGIFGTFYATIILLNNYFLAKKSAYSLTLPVAMTIYTAFLFFQRRIFDIMNLNIAFSAVITLCYLFFFAISIKRKANAP